jgi:hypothetical protein
MRGRACGKRFASGYFEIKVKPDVSDSQIAGARRHPVRRVLIAGFAILIVTTLVIATQNNSSALVNLGSAHSVDGLVIRLPQGWSIESGKSCATHVSSVLINVPADWQDVQCPNAGDTFATTIRIGHFSLKSGCCVSKSTSEIGGKSATELRLSNGLIYGVEWTNPITSVEFACSPYVLSRAEFLKDKAILQSVVASVRVT